ncbi:NADH-FMN oxidoreductase RutF, flavin reductase (DIM6/NTAB) family [Daejeonella rubra]|uniref:NADH-FMN oxidoreductase RutF, flavin reductase (DIM6/NTAB) family n=1 Tax=Daejeonella rubra TaxID=990371 RepID=A0A1G9YMZ4_9SPHI|nr:flavin reductase [Daejeonella rubra]SDN09935.1 NADH-FMN oxidoreductase RutF, flavin reductase (DIM6/NTAB) family [Daejeonella rubra]
MKRPWNIIDSPVYSLATYFEGKVNMNICTYVSAISMEPKIYAIAIYNETKTLENMFQTGRAILQFLHPVQFNLVRNLGQRSGLTFNKQQYLEKNNLLESWNGFQVLKNTSARILLEKIDFKQTGDHVLFTFRAEKYKTYHPEVLTSEILRIKKIIRA